MADNYCLGSSLFLIGLIPTVICCITTISTAFISINAMQKLSASTHKQIRIIFYVACMSSTADSILCVVCTIYCDNTSITSSIILIVTRSVYYVLTSVIVYTLLLRVYLAFANSIYALTKYQKRMFIFLYSIIVINLLADTACEVFEHHYGFSDEINIFYSISWIIFIVFTIIATFYGMYVFIQKMLKCTKIEADHEILQQTSKYISLLFLAIATTGIGMLLLSIVYRYCWGYDDPYLEAIGQQFISIIQSIDCTVNIICLSLQYSFAKEYYAKYCKCWSNIWTKFIIYITKTKRNKAAINMNTPSDKKFGDIQDAK